MLLNILDVEHCVLAVARGGQKTRKSPETSDVLPCQPLGHCTKSNGLDGSLDGPGLTCFCLLRLMFEPQVDGRQTGGGVSQGLSLCNACCQDDAVLHSKVDGSALASRCVLGLAGLAGLFALNSLHHGRCQPEVVHAFLHQQHAQQTEHQ